LSLTELGMQGPELLRHQQERSQEANLPDVLKQGVAACAINAYLAVLAKAHTLGGSFRLELEGLGGDTQQWTAVLRLKAAIYLVRVEIGGQSHVEDHHWIAVDLHRKVLFLAHDMIIAAPASDLSPADIRAFFGDRRIRAPLEVWVLQVKCEKARRAGHNTPEHFVAFENNGKTERRKMAKATKRFLKQNSRNDQ
jgi:hypothetical protein